MAGGNSSNSKPKYPKVQFTIFNKRLKKPLSLVGDDQDRSENRNETLLLKNKLVSANTWKMKSVVLERTAEIVLLAAHVLKAPEFCGLNHSNSKHFK